MKMYDVCAIGNALVDIAVEVDDAFLTQHGIDKGTMNLVDQPTQNQLMDVIDMSKAKKMAGGSAANTVISVNQLGGKASYLSVIGDDDYGEYFIKDMEKNGVHTNASHANRQKGSSGKCLVMVTPDAERTMNTYLGVSAAFSENNVDEKIIQQATYLYIEGYLMATPHGAEAIIKAQRLARQHHTLIALSLSDVNIVRHCRQQMDCLTSSPIDLLFANEQEAVAYTGTDNVEQICEQMKKIAYRFIITRGSLSAWAYDGTLIEIPSHSVQAIDTTGAGDVFAGAFLYGLTHGHTFLKAGNISMKAASQIVTQYGARLSAQRVKNIMDYMATNC